MICEHLTHPQLPEAVDQSCQDEGQEEAAERDCQQSVPGKKFP